VAPLLLSRIKAVDLFPAAPPSITEISISLWDSILSGHLVAVAKIGQQFFRIAALIPH